MSKLALFQAIIFVALTISGIIWTQDLEQINEETIFLTEESRQEYDSFKEEFHIRSLVVGKMPKDQYAQLMPELKDRCGDICEIIDHKDLPEKPKNLKLINEQNTAFLMLQKEDATRLQFKEALKRILSWDKNNTIEFSGVPYTNVLLDQYSQKVKTTIFPSLFAGVFLLLLFYLRSFKFAVIVFIPGLMGSSLSLSGTKLIQGHSDLISAIIPLLLFVVQISMVLHIHFTAIELKALEKALKDKIEPVALMVVTTFIGFGSLYFSDLFAISQFGLLTAVFLLLSTGGTYMWLFTLNRLVPSWWQRDHQVIERAVLYKILGSFWSRKTIYLFSFLSLGLGLYSLKKITIITDATRYFPKETMIREKMVALSKEFIGSPLVEIILTLKEGNTYPQLNDIYQKELALEKELPGIFLSANQLVALANLNYSGTDNLPENEIAYFTLKGKVPMAFGEGYPSDEHYRITYLGAPENVDIYEEDLKKIKKAFSNSPYELKFNGLYFHLMRAQSRMIVTLFKSFFLSLVLISVLSFLYYRKVKVFFIFMAVNIIPVFASFPLIWMAGISFNIATVMTYSISLGLIVDSSYHIVHALNQENIDKNFFVKSVLQPILGASTLLAICFILFSLSDFLPIKEFGLSLAILILLGMVLDLKVLPALFRKDFQ